MRWLLLLMPLAIALEHFAYERALLIFVVAGLGIVPLASLMAQATGSLAARLGPGIGGLLNATFGNAAELIIALAALRSGLHDMVKACWAWRWCSAARDMANSATTGVPRARRRRC